MGTRSWARLSKERRAKIRLGGLWGILASLENGSTGRVWANSIQTCIKEQHTGREGSQRRAGFLGAGSELCQTWKNLNTDFWLCDFSRHQNEALKVSFFGQWPGWRSCGWQAELVKEKCRSWLCVPGSSDAAGEQLVGWVLHWRCGSGRTQAFQQLLPVSKAHQPHHLGPRLMAPTCSL